MILEKLSLIHYKSFEEKQFTFDAKINCLVGANGMGKTNVLDAIYHLAYGKSFFNPQSLQNIQHGKDFFVIDGIFQRDQRTENIVCSLKKGQKKILKRNGKIYEKFSEHLGFLPLVMISPMDQDLIWEGSETRRKFLDLVISNTDSVYLHQLIQYQKVISQRNALLKFFAINRTFDATTLEIYNTQLGELGTPIFKKRKEFVENLMPIFLDFYYHIAPNKEQVSLQYVSDLETNSMEELLEESLPKDKVLQYTSKGIHKDDLDFLIDGHPLKKFGSQGQQKTYLIALKLAQFSFLKKKCNHLPILLFDDIFDKLDAERVQTILDLVNQDTFGQLFITDTHPERTEEIVIKTRQSYQMIAINKS